MYFYLKDIAIGAPHGNMVFIYKSYPIITVNNVKLILLKNGTMCTTNREIICNYDLNVPKIKFYVKIEYKLKKVQNASNYILHLL